MPYTQSEKETYLKQKRAHDAKKTGKPFLTFGRWLGGSKGSKTKAKAAPKKSAYTASYNVARKRRADKKALKEALEDK